MGEGSSVRVLVVGAETGKLAKSLMDRGASHVLVIDHSQVRHP
jgi:electron transfer flavoprotein alpha subunit